MEINSDLKSRIIMNPNVKVGKSVIKGTRITVALILNMLANGASYEEIFEEYPSLVSADIFACLHFANQAIQGTTFMPLTSN